ncbi:MAG: transglutaminase domain-containing protein [Spirochaetes bacterium]|nr:transglutaminase domain-containing protein [Spirochaetota bacterium]
MARSRVIIIFVVLISLFIDQGLLSKPAKKKYRPRHARSRPVRIVKERPKPPDPALEWKDCGEYCLRNLFGSDMAGVRINPVTGEIRDIAIQGGYIYLLVKNFNLITDAIFIIRKDSGRIESIWGIGRQSAEGITCDGQFIWIISSSEKYFLRKLSLSGRGSGDIAIKTLPKGDIRGIACAGDNVFFTARADEESVLYLFNRQSRALKKIGSYRGGISGIACFQGNIIAGVNEFDTYSGRWLLVMGPDGGLKKKLSFVNSDISSMTSDGKRVYFLEKRFPGARVSPIVVLMDGNMVLADPRIQRVELTFPIKGNNSNLFNVDLWLPYPMNRKFQNVRAVAIEPRPLEVTLDRFGNRWARVRWERVSGSVRAVMKFDIITAAVAFTIEPKLAFEPAAIPADVRKSFLGETGVFDLSSYVIKSHSSRIETEGPGLARILAIRDYVNGAIRFSGYGDRWVKASDYLFRGRGDAYGQTVGFAAVSRFLGIPARAAGGILLDGAQRERESDYSLPWNQVYLPGSGWVDIGIGRDYDHGREQFACRPGRVFITMEGDFDTVDYATVFTEKEWTRACRWSSVDKNRPADVSPGAVQVKAQELRE